MLQSMTGFGRTEFTLGDYICSIEIKSLNGKQLELNVKIPSIIKNFEIDLRNRLQQKLTRGSVEVSIYLKQHGVSKPVTVNTNLASYYYESMQNIATHLNLPINDPLSVLMRMPEIVGAAAESMSDEDWVLIAKQIDLACDLLNQQRIAEGKMLTTHIDNNISKINNLCHEVQPFEANRVERVRERLNVAMQTFMTSNTYDKNRLEQEMIFYIEKFDITEEKNRLKHHCEYFQELLNDDNNSKGKRLGFVLQEIGREINTMGSKANDADIQKIVVMMKDELEQAKEQLLNAL